MWQFVADKTHSCIYKLKMTANLNVLIDTDALSVRCDGQMRPGAASVKETDWHEAGIGNTGLGVRSGLPPGPSPRQTALSPLGFSSVKQEQNDDFRVCS